MPYPALSPAAPSDPVAFLSAPSANRPPQGAPAPGSTAPFKPFRIDPLNREPTAKSATVPSKPSRIDPLNREPGAFQDPEPPTRTSFPWTRSYPRTHAMRRTRGASAAGKKIFAADERR